jgi:hypothetical protein
MVMRQPFDAKTIGPRDQVSPQALQRSSRTATTITAANDPSALQNGMPGVLSR